MPEIIQRLHFGLLHCEGCGFRSSTTVNARKVRLCSEAMPCSCLNSIFHFLVHQGVTFWHYSAYRHNLFRPNTRAADEATSVFEQLPLLLHVRCTFNRRETG